MIEYEAPNPDFERAVKERISAMPVSRFYGFRFGVLAPGEAEIVQPYREELSHQEGFFQGITALRSFWCMAGDLIIPGIP